MYILFFGDRVLLCILGWLGICYDYQASSELMEIHLPLLLNTGIKRCVSTPSLHCKLFMDYWLTTSNWNHGK